MDVTGKAGPSVHRLWCLFLSFPSPVCVCRVAGALLPGQPFQLPFPSRLQWPAISMPRLSVSVPAVHGLDVH